MADDFGCANNYGGARVVTRFRIIRVRRKGKPLTVAETWHNGIEARSEADAISQFRQTSAGRIVPPDDLAAIAVERKRA